jgi:hypothetical protein
MTGYATRHVFYGLKLDFHINLQTKKEQNMSSNLIVSRFSSLRSHFLAPTSLDLHSLYLYPEQLPKFVRTSADAMRALNLLGPLAWGTFPERNLQRNYGQPSTPYAALAAACLVKLDRAIGTFSRLVSWLADSPSMAWLLGFRKSPGGFNPARAVTLPDQRHFSRLLHKAPNACFQFLLASSVQVLLTEFAQRNILVPDTISLDTKHILAWVKENNPKAYIENRFDKTKQPAGDRDCKLGCKRRHNRRKVGEEADPATPLANPVPGSTVQVGEFYWGYASGVAAVKASGWGEFILAEMTQPFDRSDVSYFFPLIEMVEQRLGKKPRFGALDAAFDAFYIYDYFHQAGGFAAVPFAEKGKTVHRQFDRRGLPLCTAGLPMPLKATYWDRTTAIIEYERGQYVCPLFHPEPTHESCPAQDEHWHKGGCITTLATSLGARVRHQLDRSGEAYREIYKQRTAVERIFSQAVELGIERPKLRNGRAIANLNTLIYTLINLRLLQRLKNQV